MFSIRLANGKEASFEHAIDLYNWYIKEKRAAKTPKGKDLKNETKEKALLQDS